jgi:hypothetical protein
MTMNSDDKFITETAIVGCVLPAAVVSLDEGDLSQPHRSRLKHRTADKRSKFAERRETP